ncbi:ATP-dependent DNA helicase yku80 [Ciborinia camelliae]|nr:ATP-dependent DNA helicase yku80 [Ciborinia camelliae]
MSEKQATVYVVDLGKSLGDCHNGRVETDLEYGMRYVWDKITLTMSTDRKTDGVGIVGFRTDDTKNDLHAGGEEGYENISALKPLGQFQMQDLEEMREVIKPSSTNAGDAISAVVVAMEMIKEFTTLKSGKPGKYARKIVLITDGNGFMHGEELDDIAKEINNNDIRLVVLGVDFDDAEFGFKEEDKDLVKAENEKLLRSFTESCTDGMFATAEEAIEAIATPVVKVTREYKTYEGPLTLGDPKKYPETAVSIDVARYFRTHQAKPPSARSYVDRMIDGSIDVEMPDTGGFTSVRQSRTYKVNDPTAPGGKRDVERDALEKGFEYGSSIVPINQSDENVTKLQALKDFSIIGFVPIDYEIYLNMGETCITIPQKTNDKARMALSSLVHALHEMESCAVARLVKKDGSDPQIVLLSPFIEPDLEGLIDVPLPFAEDIRSYRFAPLDKVFSSSGSLIDKHKNLPSSDLKAAMGAFVDSMDLSTAGKDEEGKPAEYMAIEDTYSPVLHRISQAIRRRAVKPNEGVLPPANILTKWSHPPSELVDQSRTELETLIARADVKKVPPTAKFKRNREVIKPLSGLDVQALLSREKRQKISVDNAIPEFKQALSSTDSTDSIIKATREMGDSVRALLKRSTGNSTWAQAGEYLRTMRTELIDLIEPDIYNNFIEKFKKQLQNEDFDKMFWFEVVRKNKLGLIHGGEAENTTKTEEEARQA